jgi:hypothetical protein
VTTLSTRQYESRRTAVAPDERHIQQHPLTDHDTTVDDNDPGNPG